MAAASTHITIGPETEGPHGWHYQVQVRQQDRVWNYQVTLSWSDYDLWSRGRTPPSIVVERVFAFLLARESAAEILPRFDCALVRRYFPEVDQHLSPGSDDA